MRRVKTLLGCVAFLVVSAIATPNTLSAQYTYRFRDSLGSYKVQFTPHETSKYRAAWVRKPVVARTHELRAGLGFASFLPDFSYTTDDIWIPQFNNVASEDTKIAPPRWVTLNFDYGYWCNEWLYVGASFTWSGGFAKEFAETTFKRVDTYNYNAFGLMPMVRFAWLRRNIVQLYSGIGIGAAFYYYEKPQYHKPRIEPGASYDVTFIGISVGRKWFGYCDIGTGTRGVISMGIGYRFNAKNRSER